MHSNQVLVKLYFTNAFNTLRRDVMLGSVYQQLVGALTDFINLLLRGDFPQEVRPILFGGNMIALNKNTGGLRPIAVGYVWRRLAAKCANRYAVARLSSHFASLQLGIGVPGGCEAAVHAARRFVKGMRRNQVLVKLDFTNAFNTLKRDLRKFIRSPTRPTRPSLSSHLVISHCRHRWAHNKETLWVLFFSACHFSPRCVRLAQVLKSDFSTT